MLPYFYCIGITASVLLHRYYCISTHMLSVASRLRTLRKVSPLGTHLMDVEINTTGVIFVVLHWALLSTFPLEFVGDSSLRYVV